MRLIRFFCALVVATGAPVAVEAQEGGPGDLTKAEVKVAAKKQVKKRVDRKRHV